MHVEVVEPVERVRGRRARLALRVATAALDPVAGVPRVVRKAPRAALAAAEQQADGTSVPRA